MPILLLGLLTGWLTRPFLALFARYEVPLSLSNLLPVFLYLLLVQGLAVELAKYLTARLSFRLSPRAPKAALLLLVAFPVGQALDPALHAFYLLRPHRLLLQILVHVLVSAPWLAALLRSEPTRSLVLQSAWRLALLSLLDRETGLATAVLVLLLCQQARDAFRAWRPLLLECP